MKTSIKHVVLTILFSITLCINQPQAATHIISEGQLIGADNVFVDGTYYDVEFKDTDAESLFYKDGTWNFTFNNRPMAVIASQALLDQVFINLSGIYKFDDTPSLTIGIEHPTYGRAWTPWTYNVFDKWNAVTVQGASNSYVDQEYYDNVLGEGFYKTEDLLWDSHNVYAVWTESVVPIPSTVSLLGIGLFCLAGINRKTVNSGTGLQSFQQTPHDILLPQSY